MTMKTDTKSFYKSQEIKSSTPAELINHLYDFGIDACHKKDDQRLKNVLSELIKSLNFDLPMSEDFYLLYDYCRQKANTKDFKDALTILEDMREAWKPVVESQRINTSPIKSFNMNA